MCCVCLIECVLVVVLLLLLVCLRCVLSVLMCYGYGYGVCCLLVCVNVWMMVCLMEFVCVAFVQLRWCLCVCAGLCV